jgi:sorting nexin-41/42
MPQWPQRSSSLTWWPASEQSPPQAAYNVSPNQPSQYDDDDETNVDSGPVPPKGGYDSRVQQVLYEQPDLEIIIIDAGKSSDGGYIVYKIRTGVRSPPFV